MTSKGIDTSVEFVTLEQDLKRRPASEARGSSIGLGYRVPLVIASPWSRGGFVNSQVFDHTSILQFMEKFLNHKTQKKIEESNISTWRRTICGDMTSAFRPYNGEKISLPAFLDKNTVIESIHKAKFKRNPSGYKPLTADDIEQIKQRSQHSLMPKQEPGVRPSCSLPYQLYAEGSLSEDRQTFNIQFEASSKVFGSKSAGSAFHVYTNNNKDPRAYAVIAGDRLMDAWKMNDFENSNYDLCVYGANGFFREFTGNSNDPLLDVKCEYETNGKFLTGNVNLVVTNKSNRSLSLKIADEGYKKNNTTKTITSGSKTTIKLNLKESHNWYDFSISVNGFESFKKRYAGRVETGKDGFTDPAMGT